MVNQSRIYISYILSFIPNSECLNTIVINNNKVTVTIDSYIDENDYICILESLGVLLSHSKIKEYSSTKVGNKTYIEFTV